MNFHLSDKRSCVKKTDGGNPALSASTMFVSGVRGLNPGIAAGFALGNISVRAPQAAARTDAGPGAKGLPSAPGR